MPQPEQLHTLSIKYPPYEANRVMTTVSVADFNDFEPVDFREFLPPEQAVEEFRVIAPDVVREVLRLRQESFGETRAVPNMGAITSFLGKLAIKPFGKLSYVDELTILGQPIESPGATSTLHRQSFIVGKHADGHGGVKAGRSSSLPLPRLSRDTLIESIGVHELAHLAGIPDVAYYIMDRERPRAIKNLTFSPLALKHKDNKRGGFFEEGFATLIAYTYLWKQHPEVVASTKTDLRKSPKGTEVDLPIRHAFYTNTYAYMAWAIERLTDFSPKVWDILLRSRVYGESSDNVRGALKGEIDKLSSRLFKLLDATDPKSINQVMYAAAVVDALVDGAIGR